MKRDYGNPSVGNGYAGGGIGLGPAVSLVELEPYPGPEVSSRDGVVGPDKTATAGLKRKAEGFGWSVEVTYARGCFPHATHGTPGAVKDSLALRMTRGTDRAVAVYSWAGTAWTWTTLAIQRPGAWPRRFETVGVFQESLL